MLVGIGALRTLRLRCKAWETPLLRESKLILVVVLCVVHSTVAGLSIGTAELMYVLNNTSKANWGCLEAVHIAGDTDPTPAGIFAGPGASTPLWQLTVSTCNESFPSGAVMQSCTVVCQRKYALNQTSTSATLRWEECATPFPPSTLSIEVTVKVTGGVSTFGATVDKQHAGGLCLQSFTLPDLRTLRMRPGKEELYLPHYFGTQGSCGGGYERSMGPWMPDVCQATHSDCSDGASKEQSGWLPNGSDRTMSFTAWLSGPANTPGGVGLYVGAHDPYSRLKMLTASCLQSSPAGDFTHAGLRSIHVPESFNSASTASFVLPYEVVVAAINGDWWDASQVYRAWALDNAHWTRKGKLSSRPDIPQWLLATPIWVRLSGADDPLSNATQDKVKAVRDALGGTGISGMGVHWYSWNTEKFDSKYPVYTAKPGFKEAVAQMQQPHAGITAHVIPYTNGRIWDPANGMNLTGATCKGRNQVAYNEVYHSGVSFSVMDPSQTLMQDTWSDVVGRIATTYNTSGVYTDQVSCSHAEACYDTVNGTNSSAWRAGSEALLSKMATKVGIGRAIISEAHDQTMMSDLHAYLSIYGWIGALACKTVLSWQAVYGGWSVNVGDMRYPSRPQVRNESTGKLYFNETEAAAWRAITAQNMLAGNVMGWFGAGSNEWNQWLGLAEGDIAFIRLMASTKVSAAKYLTHGRLWRPPRWNVLPPVMKLHDYSYVTHNDSQFCLTSMLLGELWRADDGTFALVVANHALMSLQLNVTVNLAEINAAERLVNIDSMIASRSVFVHVLE